MINFFKLITDISVEPNGAFTSIHAIENMMGTVRSNSRYIRIEFKRKDNNYKIMPAGEIKLQGQLFEFQEYLPSPKIFLCSKCRIRIKFRQELLNKLKKGIKATYRKVLNFLYYLVFLLNDDRNKIIRTRNTIDMQHDISSK